MILRYNEFVPKLLNIVHLLGNLANSKANDTDEKLMCQQHNDIQQNPICEKTNAERRQIIFEFIKI